MIASGFSGERIKGREEPIPDCGPESILSVPGAVSGWQALLNGAPFTPELLEPAIRLAEQGAPIDESLQRWMRPDNEEEWRDVMANRDGGVFRQPQLAETLRLMSQGRDFYCCKISARLCESLEELGVPIAKPDFHFQHVEWVEPACQAQDDYEIWTLSQDAPALGDDDCSVSFTVVDDDGRAVFARQTLHRPWGSGICCPRTGILFQNSGRAFSRDRSQPRALAPRQRPALWPAPVLIARGREFFLAGEEHRDMVEAVRNNPVCVTHVNG